MCAASSRRRSCERWAAVVVVARLPRFPAHPWPVNAPNEPCRHRALRGHEAAQLRTMEADLLLALPALKNRRYATSIPAYHEAHAAGTPLLPMFPPPLLPAAAARRPLPSACAAPFLTRAVGSLPRGIPDDADELLGLYFSGATRKPPNLDVNFENVERATFGNLNANRIIRIKFD